MDRTKKQVFMNTKKFQQIIWDYYRTHGRNLPWRNTHNPYHILISEIMLQQTQVARVLLYYQRFLRAFPNFSTLSRASLASIIRIWQGLGYNRRALYLQKLAKIVRKQYGGKLPKDPALLAKLPGIGKATAGATTAFAFNTPSPFIETNIRRVFIHFFFPHTEKVSDTQILPIVEKTINRRNPREWCYALMDYGAMLGREGENPNRRSKIYHRQPPFAGSDRELRGKIIAILAHKNQVKKAEFFKYFPNRVLQLKSVFSGLQRDGLIKTNRDALFSR